MEKKAVTPRQWTKPGVRRLGNIKNVHGAQTPVTQAVNTKS